MKNLKIIYQNKDYIVIDKPAGLAVHPGIAPLRPRSGASAKEKTLADFLIEKFPKIKNVGDNPELRPGIVHRLDKETSGVMIVAKTPKAHFHLKNLFKSRKVGKKYLALVHGTLKNKEGKIEGEMGRSKRDFRKQALARGKINVRKERYSLTRYKVLKEFGECSLVEVSPKTGRMHQIRVHFHSIGHPVVGDEKYSFKRHRKEKYPRMFLHAAQISFAGLNGEEYSFEGPPPKEFGKFLR